MIPLPRKDRTTGALCFGSRDASHRFTRHHGTDFLSHLGAVAAVCFENAINRHAFAARRDHRFSDRVAQPALSAAALERGVVAGAAPRRHHRLPDDRHRPLQEHQRRLRSSRGRQWR